MSLVGASAVESELSAALADMRKEHDALRQEHGELREEMRLIQVSVGEIRESMAAAHALFDVARWLAVVGGGMAAFASGLLGWLHITHSK